MNTYTIHTNYRNITVSTADPGCKGGLFDLAGILEYAALKNGGVDAYFTATDSEGISDSCTFSIDYGDPMICRDGHEQNIMYINPFNPDKLLRNMDGILCRAFTSISEIIRRDIERFDVDTDVYGWAL